MKNIIEKNNYNKLKNENSKLRITCNHLYKKHSLYSNTIKLNFENIMIVF